MALDVEKVSPQYEYDIAFSFLDRDENLASNLNDLLRDRVKTFLYTERQMELAGTEGDETFARVFRESARMVVVLFRPEWGKTKWTRVEETAIRSRAFELGFQFLKFIPLADPPGVPVWLPPTQIWVGLEKWGVDGAAAILEERLRELGAHPHQETVEEHAARTAREIGFQERQERYLWDVGAREAVQQFELLEQEIKRLAGTIKQSSGISLSAWKERYFHDTIYVTGLEKVLSIFWHSTSSIDIS